MSPTAWAWVRVAPARSPKLQAPRRGNNCAALKRVSTCRKLPGAALSAYYTPWQWAGKGKSVEQVARIALGCMSQVRRADVDLADVGPDAGRVTHATLDYVNPRVF